MTPNAGIPPRVIGCDVGKKTITVFDTATGRTGETANTVEALLAFAQDLPPDCLVICEATGGYETGLLLATMEAGIPVHRADARKVKAFIRSRGTLGKTDGIDARGLARYGQERQAELPRWQPAGGMQEEIRTLIRLSHPAGQAARRAEQPDQGARRCDRQKAPQGASQCRLRANRRHRGRHPSADRARSRHRHRRRHHQGDPGPLPPSPLPP